MSDASHVRSAPRGALNNAGWNAFATIWNIGLGLLLTPLLIHYLGTAQYGLLLLVWSITGLLTITNLGVGEATLRFVSHYLADGDMRGVNRVFGSTLAFYLGVCAIVTAALFPVSPSIVALINMPPEAVGEAAWLLRVSALLFSVGMISNAFRSIPMALHRYDITTKIGFAHGSIRTIGFGVLILMGHGALQVILWDLAIAAAVFLAQLAIARSLIPGLSMRPRVSTAGFREIFGYSVYSFLTHVFLSAYRESGKLILGNQFGPTSVAYLGTPDSIAYRISMVVISGVETLMPRFSSSRDRDAAKTLVMNGTQTALSIAAILFVPLAALMPDFLRLWIGPEFARESAAAGRLLALSFVGSTGFSVIATYYRGIGRPGVVSTVMASVGIVVVAASVVLAPSYGPVGVAYAYLLGSVMWLAGLAWGWFGLFEEQPLKSLMRSAGVPILVGTLAFAGQVQIVAWAAGVDWVGFVLMGNGFAASIFLVLLIADDALGGFSPTRQVVERIGLHNRIAAAGRRMQLWQPR